MDIIPIDVFKQKFYIDWHGKFIEDDGVVYEIDCVDDHDQIQYKFVCCIGERDA